VFAHLYVRMIGGDYLIKCKIQYKYFLFGLMPGLTFGLFFSNTPFGHVNATARSRTFSFVKNTRVMVFCCSSCVADRCVPKHDNNKSSAIIIVKLAVVKCQ
jgi:hypothetical protein